MLQNPYLRSLWGSWLRLWVPRTLHKKWSFPLRISSVKVTSFVVSWGFGHISWRNPLWKTSLFVQWKCLIIMSNKSRTKSRNRHRSKAISLLYLGWFVRNRTRKISNYMCMVAFSFHRFPYLFELKTSGKVRLVLDKLIPFADCERL